jgi:hypothetical protein
MILILKLIFSFALSQKPIRNFYSPVENKKTTTLHFYYRRAASEEPDRPEKKAKLEEPRSFDGQTIPSNQPLLLSGGMYQHVLTYINGEKQRHTNFTGFVGIFR